MSDLALIGKHRIVGLGGSYLLPEEKLAFSLVSYHRDSRTTARLSLRSLMKYAA